MADEVGIAVVGVSGRMGRLLAREVLATPGATLSGATVRPGHAWTGKDLGEALGGQPVGVIVEDDPLEVFARSQAVLDFTSPAATVALAELAAQARLVHVVGTTGLDSNGLDRLAAAARHAVVIRSGNMSVGVTLLADLTRRVAGALGPEYDIEIVEMHHRAKLDAPSGTALLLGEAAAEARGVKLADAGERGRDGFTGARADGAIGFASLRGGDVVGEHQVIFAGPGERLVLGHIATDRALFARGAVRAALWGQGKPPGEYTMRDVLGLEDPASNPLEV
jgi:4-hydroxy-tetrahydrodipicolinate reductase